MVTVEHWRDCVGYEGYYQVSNLGRVRNVRGGRVLKNLLTKEGLYLKVNLSREGKVKTEYVHQLVAYAWLGGRPEGYDLCHNDGDGTNNNVGNLRWDTRTENARDTVRHGKNKCSLRTHCPLGHELSGGNLVANHPTRKCKSCTNARAFLHKKGLPLSKEVADRYYERYTGDV